MNNLIPDPSEPYDNNTDYASSFKKRLHSSQHRKLRAKSMHMKSTVLNEKAAEKNELPKEDVARIIAEIADLSGHKGLALILTLTKKAKKKNKSNELLNLIGSGM